MDILTLHSGPLSKLTSTTNKIAYIVKWFFSNPGFISDNYNNLLISYREIQGKYGDNPEALTRAISESLQSVLASIIPEETIIVEADKTNIDDFYYTIELTFRTDQGDNLLLKSSINIKDNDITINTRT